MGMKVGDIAGGNFFEVEPDGTPVARGTGTVYDDLVGELTPSKQGVNLKPDYDYTNLGLLFPQNNTAQKANIIFQMSHSKVLGSPIHLHLHYIQAVAQQPTFVAEYRFYNNGGEIPGDWLAVTSADVGGSKGIFDFTANPILQIASFPDIAAPSVEGVSANLDVILYRNDNDVSGTVLAKYIDLHFEKDTAGSRSEYTK